MRTSILFAAVLGFATSTFAQESSAAIAVSDIASATGTGTVGFASWTGAQGSAPVPTETGSLASISSSSGFNSTGGSWSGEGGDDDDDDDDEHTAGRGSWDSSGSVDAAGGQGINGTVSQSYYTYRYR